MGELLQAGIDRDHVNRIGYQAVHEAVWLGRDTPAYVDTLRVLVAGGVELTRRSRDEGLTPLQMARERGHTRLEGVLVKATTTKPPADPDAALLAAAARGDADAVAGALRAGADLEARDDRRRTALLLAVTGDHVDAARVLVALGADPDALDDRHDTPWLVTGVTGSVAMLEALLPARPDLTIRNRYGGVSVIPASERGHVDYVRRVVTTGIDVNHVNDLGWTALLEAVILGDGGRDHQEIVRILLAAGADAGIARQGRRDRRSSMPAPRGMPRSCACWRRPLPDGEACRSGELGDEVGADLGEHGIGLRERHVDEVVVLAAGGGRGDECRDPGAALEERLLDLPPDDALAVEHDALPVERAVPRDEVRCGDGMPERAIAVDARARPRRRRARARRRAGRRASPR